MSEPLVERLHRFFVRVFTTEDLFDKEKRQEMRIESLALDDAVEKLEAENKMLVSADFWSNWVYPEGAKPEDIQNELADFKDLIDRFSKVLDHATGGRMSKANYTVEAMCSEIDDYYGQT